MVDYRAQKGIILMGAILAGGTVLFKYLEDWTWVEAFYFTGVTVTTIGYGDIHPTHDVSRILTVIFGIVSVTLLFYIIGVIVESRFHEKIKEHITIKDE
jgi:voltage-gated potassium channel